MATNGLLFLTAYNSLELETAIYDQTANDTVTDYLFNGTLTQS
jgi:hypothetical protein